MTRENRRKAESAPPQLVAVIASLADLQHAVRMRTPPDLFELRLDAFARATSPVETRQELDWLKQSSSCATRRSGRVRERARNLPAPLVITARHPSEGGLRKLSTRDLVQLLERFIKAARYVDIELRSVRSTTALLNQHTVRRIVSLHDFRGTPPVSRLHEKLRAARAAGADIFKLATRVDDAAQLARLLRFFDDASRVMPISAMGMGALGRESRIELARRGSVLNYGYITRAQAPGQLSVAELRRLLRG